MMNDSAVRAAKWKNRENNMKINQRKKTENDRQPRVCRFDKMVTVTEPTTQGENNIAHGVRVRPAKGRKGICSRTSCLSGGRCARRFRAQPSCARTRITYRIQTTFNVLLVYPPCARYNMLAWQQDTFCRDPRGRRENPRARRMK